MLSDRQLNRIREAVIESDEQIRRVVQRLAERGTDPTPKPGEVVRLIRARLADMVRGRCWESNPDAEKAEADPAYRDHCELLERASNAIYGK